MTITYRLSKGSALTWAELDGNFSDLDGRVSALPSEADVEQLIADSTTGQAVYRANDTRGVEPTVGEFPAPENGDAAVVWLDDGTRELWTYDGSTWTLQRTIEPSTTDPDQYLGTVGPSATHPTFPAANKNDWVIIATTGTYGSKMATRTERYRCTTDGTAANAGGFWEKIEPEDGMSDLYRRFRYNTPLATTGHTGIEVNHVIDNAHGPVVELVDSSNPQWGCWTGRLNCTSSEGVVVELTTLKTSDSNFFVDLVNYNSASDFKRIQGNPTTGEWSHVAGGAGVVDHSTVVSATDIGDAICWRFHYHLDGAAGTAYGFRVYPAVSALGTPPMVTSGAHTGSLFVAHFSTMAAEGSAATEWTDVTYSNGWTDAGAAYYGVQYRLVGDDLYLRGRCTGGTTTQLTTVFDVPLLVDPAKTVTFTAASNSRAVVMDMVTNGNCRIIDPAGSDTWLSFDGIVISQR